MTQNQSMFRKKKDSKGDKVIIKNRAEQKELEKEVKIKMLKINNRIKLNERKIEGYFTAIINNNNKIAKLRCSVEIKRTEKIQTLMSENESMERMVLKKKELNSNEEREYLILRDHLEQIENTQLESQKNNCAKVY